MNNDTPLSAADLLEMLRLFECRVSDDTAKQDPELVCTACGNVVCDIEHGDTLEVLATTARDHECP